MSKTTPPAKNNILNLQSVLGAATMDYLKFNFELSLEAFVSCLGRVTPGVKDTPFLGSARGAKEAVDLFTRREFVGGQRMETRKENNDLPRFRPPEG